MKLERNKSTYPTFPWWDTCATQVGELLIRMAQISSEDMTKLHEKHADPDKAVMALPMYISQNRAGTEVAVWPIPDADYELVRI